MIVDDLCLFCGRLPATSKEHIVLKALGGQKTTVGLLCRPCNNRLGGTVDASMERTYRPFSLVAGCYRGDGRPVAVIRDARSVQGEHYEIHHGGAGQPLRPVTVRIVRDDGVEERHLSHLDEEVLARMVAAEARKMGVSPEQVVLEGTSSSGVTFTDMALGFSSGGDQYRAVLKMGLAAASKERALVHGDEVKRAAQYVLGRGEAEKGIDPQAGLEIRRLLGTDPGQHVLLVHSVAGRWEASFLIFGIICLRVAFPEPAAGFLGVAHLVDPVERRHTVLLAPPTMQLQPLGTLQHDLELLRPMLGDLNRWLSEQLMLAKLRVVLSQMADEIRAEGGDCFEEHHLREFSMRAAAVLVGPEVAPTTQPVDLSRIVEAAQRLFDNEGDSP